MKKQMDTFDKERTLKDLIDTKTINDLAVNFKKIFHSGVALMDHQGVNFIESHLESEILSKIQEEGLQEIKEHEFFPDFNSGDEYFFYKSSSSFDFGAVPIKHEGESMAVVVLGPLLLEENNTVQTPVITAPNLRQEERNLIQYTNSEIVEIGTFLKEMFYHIIYANYQRLLTSELYLETNQYSYQELIGKSRKLEESEQRYRNLAESLEKEVEKRTKELEKAQLLLFQTEKMASIGQLAAGVAHEINNPIGFIYSNLGSLSKYSNRLLEIMKRYEEELTVLKDNGSKEAASFYEEMEGLKKKLKIDFIMKDFRKVIAESLEGTERIKKIVADLKNFSRVDQAEFKHADINQGLKSTLNVVWNELKYKCTVEKNYEDLPQVYCNLGQLNQVFMNLLVNAAQAIEEKGTITVSTRYVNGNLASNHTEQNYVEVKISDTGKGIPEDKLDRIFEPFFTTKDVGKGTGLGLSIAYDIIRKHQGEITVQSEVGNGTTFLIILPVVDHP